MFADAMPILGAVYSDEPLAFVAESFFCIGNESQLIDCPSPFPLGRPAAVSNIQNDRRHLFNVAGVRCGDGQCVCVCVCRGVCGCVWVWVGGLSVGVIISCYLLTTVDKLKII